MKMESHIRYVVDVIPEQIAFFCWCKCKENLV